MSKMRAQAMYDFDAQPSSNELTIKAGEFLNILRQDVGDGWWEGINEAGQQGLFPESYVQILTSAVGPPAAPPPPLPKEFVEDGPGSPTKQSSQNRGSVGWSQPQPSYQQQQSNDNQTSTTGGDNFDDDWSDDDSQTGDHSATRKPKDSQDSQDEGAESRQRLSSRMSCGWSEDDDGNTTTAPLSISTDKENGHPSYGTDATGASQTRTVDPRGGTMKKSMNRFSPFVKSGTEAYLLNNAKLTQKPSNMIEIVITKEGPEWAQAAPQSCQIHSTQKSSKLKGLKSFITYQLTPSVNNLQVSRRYKHFDWLHARLQDKFSIIFIPPLPEKQVTGRYEDEFVEHRMHLLQLWITKICRHPVLSQSEVWQHFLRCTDEKEWKKGKRSAEKDEYSGGSLFFTIKPPAQPLDMNDVEQQIDSFNRCSKMLDDGVRNFQSTASDTAKKMVGPYKRECCKLGSVFRTLATSFENDPNAKAKRLANAVQSTADCYDAMGKMYEEQPKSDVNPLLNELYVYKGMLGAAPDILQVQKSAMSKLRDSHKLHDEGKLSANELESIRARVDTISYATLAEINNFQRERLEDFDHLIGNFLKAQIGLYQGIVERLQGALRNFE